MSSTTSVRRAACDEDQRAGLGVRYLGLHSMRPWPWSANTLRGSGWNVRRTSGATWYLAFRTTSWTARSGWTSKSLWLRHTDGGQGTGWAGSERRPPARTCPLTHQQASAGCGEAVQSQPTKDAESMDGQPVHSMSYPHLLLHLTWIRVLCLSPL